MNRAIRLGSLLLLTLLLAGCVSGVGGDDGLTDSDREALASLGYLADELAEKGWTRPETRRVLVLAIDGMDWLLTKKWMEEGKLPHFQQLAEKGGFSPLMTSIPPQSPVAWSNFITGADPGGHGIFDFLHRDAKTYFPYLSVSKVQKAPKKAKVMGIPMENKLAVPLTDYEFPLAGGTTLNLRRGVAFWQVLEAAGIPSTMYKIPANFPPVPSKDGLFQSISGLGAPDLLGTYGTFTLFSTDPPYGSDDWGGARVERVRVEDGVVRARLYGPANDFKNYKKIEARTGERVRYDEKKVTAEFEIMVDPENPVAMIHLGDQEVLLNQGEFSDWMNVEFEMVPGVVKVDGIVRFLLKSVHPKFELYASPINIDPANPALPIADPPEYGEELVAALGPFYTQGMAEDTKALEHGVFGNDEFTRQARLVFEERRRAFDYHLERFEEGLLYFYFSSLDQCSHAMWRCMDSLHPAHVPERDEPYADFLQELYQDMDDVLAQALREAGEDTLVMVVSDHGFAPWYREFNLNTWLHQEGYLVLKPGIQPDRVEWLTGVDWSRTRAYGFGINGLYVNQQDREAKGMVPPGPESQELISEIAAKLEGLIDPETGQRVVVRANQTDDVYHGPYTDTAPDIIVGYGRGYRGSDDTASGKIPPDILIDNLKMWSGDHCADHIHVPGVLATNRPIRSTSPALTDMAPTILEEFGIEKRSWMIGQTVF